MIKLRILAPFVIYLLLFVECTGYDQDAGKEKPEYCFLLVRHAEKKMDGTKDPMLSEVGIQRSERLTVMLQQQALTGIYATPYKRCLLTAQKVSEAQSISIDTYQPHDDNFLSEVMKKHPSGGYFLVVGHSNTIPLLVNQLIGEDKYKTLEESDYNDLFIACGTELASATVTHLSY